MKPEEALRNAPMFAELSPSHIKRLPKSMSATQFAAGSVVIKEGDQADGLFVVSSGKLEGSPRSATVRAIEDSECLTMTRGDFMTALKDDPQIAVGMLPPLVRRLRNADVRITG